MKQVLVQQDYNKFYVDPILKAYLEKWKTLLRKDMDFIFIVSGREGSGKSTLAMQICKYMDPTFDLDSVHFGTQQWLNQIIDVKDKYKAVLLDEAMKVSARAFFSKINKDVVNVLSQIRQKNLIIGIVVPSFWELDKNIAVWRSQILLNTEFRGEDYAKGYFNAYPYKLKKKLYEEGRKKAYSFSVVRNRLPKMRFYGNYVLDESKYREKKYGSLNELKGGNEVKESTERDKMTNAIVDLRDQRGLVWSEIGKLFKIPKSTAHSMYEKAKSLGNGIYRSS